MTGEDRTTPRPDGLDGAEQERLRVEFFGLKDHPMTSDPTRETLRLRLTGEQIASIQPPVDDCWFTDWDEYREFEDVTFAALSTTPAPLDVERLTSALRETDVLEDWPWEEQRPEGWRHRKLAEAIAREYAKPDRSTP